MTVLSEKAALKKHSRNGCVFLSVFRTVSDFSIECQQQRGRPSFKSLPIVGRRRVHDDTKPDKKRRGLRRGTYRRKTEVTEEAPASQKVAGAAAGHRSGLRRRGKGFCCQKQPRDGKVQLYDGRCEGTHHYKRSQQQWHSGTGQFLYGENTGLCGDPQ